jgi:hypothetical protein
MWAIRFWFCLFKVSNQVFYLVKTLKINCLIMFMELQVRNFDSKLMHLGHCM